MIIYTHSECLLKDNGFNHPERKERLDSILESIKQIKDIKISFKEAPLADMDAISLVHPKKHIEKIFLVTFPHKKNFNKTYKLNVSDVIDNIAQKRENVTHINFSKTLLNDKNFNYQNIWTSDNIHLNPENHANLFMKGILEELLRYLQ